MGGGLIDIVIHNLAAANPYFEEIGHDTKSVIDIKLLCSRETKVLPHYEVCIMRHIVLGRNY